MEAIILGLIRHSDKASILRTYTRTHGRVNFIVYGSRKRYAALYTPLSIVEIISSGNQTSIQSPSMPAVKEASLSYIPQSITQDVVRQSVCLFIAEILGSILVHPMADDDMFNFILSTIKDLDCSDDVANVHLRFLRNLCLHLGVAIDEEEHPELVAAVHTRQERQQMLQALCFYIEQHIDGFRSPKSLDVLMELFD